MLQTAINARAHVQHGLQQGAEREETSMLLVEQSHKHV